MIRKKKPSTVSFLKYVALLSFLTGIVVTSISVMSNSLAVDYFQYFPSWFALELSLMMREESSIFSAVFFSIAYLISCLLYKYLPVDSHNTNGNLMIKKISGESREKYSEKNVPKNDQNFAGLVHEKIDRLSIEIDAARHDLFNLMLDINGIHSADDAQKSLDSLEKSISIIKDLKRLKVNGK
ncbi:MAG: hypothetical protein EVA26_04225 [Burkholderiaceae bacterium]|nr:MAG: hypothetical protein EVA26_04225 [Burkholderiaceae bacterium]